MASVCLRGVRADGRVVAGLLVGNGHHPAQRAPQRATTHKYAARAHWCRGAGGALEAPGGPRRALAGSGRCGAPEQRPLPLAPWGQSSGGVLHGLVVALVHRGLELLRQLRIPLLEALVPPVATKPNTDRRAGVWSWLPSHSTAESSRATRRAGLCLSTGLPGRRCQR